MDAIDTAKRSKRTVTVILVITALLAVASVITGYYYLQINDVSPQDSNASQGCACYFVATTNTVQSCASANPKMAYEFQTGTKQSDNACSASCDLRTSAPLVIANQTTLACKVDEFTINPGCVDVSVEDIDAKRYANDVPEDKELTVKAKFTTPSNVTSTDQDFYSGFSFIINGEKTELPATEATATGSGTEKTYTVSTKVKDYESADALNIQAFGSSTAGAQLTSDACNRSLTISKPNAPTCTELDAEILNDSNDKPKVNELVLTTSSVTNPTNLVVKFTVGDSSDVLTTKNLASQLTNGSLVLSKSYLYSASNFTSTQSFSVLDDETTNMEIKAEVLVNGTAINSDNCSGTFDIPVIDGNPSSPTDGGTNPDPDNGTDDDDDNPSTPTDGEDPEDDDTDTSDFTVTKKASVACVERAAPDNTVKYTITVKNTDSDSDKITRIEDKLPLGFEYVAGSTTVDGTAESDTGLVETTTTGSSQLVTFEESGGWTLAANTSLVIRFTAEVSSSALTGDNLNEVVVVPENTPEDNDSLRTEVEVDVAQSCTAPETALFDSTISKVLLSIFIIFLGTYFYFSQSGILLSEKLVASPLGEFVRKTGLRNSNPKKYFEEKFLEDLEKKKK